MDYPDGYLLVDNTCHLLVADFDKDDWQEAVKAMSQVCMEFEIPHAMEISRSGNGAHLWIFFSEPVTAKAARQLGFGLLDKAMEIHPNLSFESYDRLFPNQDLMPEGGFGNLIALPLQFQARQKGNSLFVDNNFSPYIDQWLFLSQIKSLSCQELKDLLVQLTPQSQRLIDDRPPWEQGVKVSDDKIESCPEQVTLTLANHIYIKFENLPSPLIAKLKRLASFSNPVFFKTQALRFSTHGIPRYITCARIEQGYLSLPRGCFDGIVELLKEQNVTPFFDDRRQSGQKLTSLKFLGKLKNEQLKAVRIIVKHNTGVLHAPTAFGKTVAAIGVISRRKVNTLILTHSRQLLEQWQERLKSFVTGVEIGIIGGGKKKPTGQIDIATYQSLINKKDNSVDCLIQDYGQVIIDECHHISAPRFEMALNEVRAKYVLGLTATPDRQDGHQKIIFMLAGPVRCKVKQDHAEKFVQKVAVTHLYHQPPEHLVSEDGRPRISDVYRWLTDDKSRAQKIVDDVVDRVAEGKNPLVLTERREHADLINQLLVDKKIQTVVMRGAMRAKERKAANERLAKTQVVVATGKYVGEGFDMPRLDTLFLALPIAWKGSLAQYAGRIHRESDGKSCVTIYDYVDSSLPMLERMFLKRVKGYKAMGYQVDYIDKGNAMSKLI
ncbi:MAG: DEAD/DEAH box helicase family protein [Gammaproteobacteria bacterium]|nr:DEAD/DEAH box helicase family protein [Gammaproteobacteria bacterium]MBT4449344.1 DEAD/DEAH box helicase family protein [Gammaproteobacteria bacterium]MBT4862312.1 DEAD/DEAH box helicase family protein [Gammaproteobacteria bacterium]MBT6552273.1 DEAD/DEAH box helicase family protein [Gammaproteobacteria bacterium]MBT6702572.1 DEAD/DEAH box helicase family protein [Gammaproteobacteria bacterium]